MSRTTRYAADEYAEIARIAKENEAERMKHLMGQPLEDAQPVEAPKDIDWGMYAPCGYTVSIENLANNVFSHIDWISYDYATGGDLPPYTPKGTDPGV